MTSQARGMDVAYRNANDAISLAERQTAPWGQVAGPTTDARIWPCKLQTLPIPLATVISFQNEFKSLSDEVSQF